MSFIKQILVLFLILFCSFNQLYAIQNVEKPFVPDSLKNRTYSELMSSFWKNGKDSTLKITYATATLKKAKMDRDTIQMLKGFYLFSHTYRDQDLVFKYADSIIDLAKKVRNDHFIGIGFLRKGSFMFAKRKFKYALDNFLSAKKHLHSSPKFNYFNEHNIGLIKVRIGDNEEAIQIFKDNLEFLEHNKIDTYKSSYLISLFSLADGYRRIKKNDSASYYNTLGLETALQYNDTLRYYQFVLNEGVNQFHLTNYIASRDSIIKVIHNFKDKLDVPNLISAYQYYGKVLSKNNKIDSAMTYFKKVDSLFVLTKDIHPKTREVYEFLINHYKSKKDLSNQLKYVNQLLKVDSVLNDNHQYLSKKIFKSYDTPRLIEEKEDIIDTLRDKNSVMSNRLLLVLGLLVISTIGLLYFYQRQKKIKNRFLQLVKDNPPSDTQKKSIPEKEFKISEEVVRAVLAQLESFEKEHLFLNSEVTLINLSKQFKTNTKYLSKIINSYKGKSFSHYINDLRINYAVDRIKKDKKFRNYTIKAISEEIGFNTTQAFSKAFHKTTGIYPSYFIKNFEKTVNNN